ncbi:hypothetical protein E2493_15350 [Sphingomonas parva]|uniref:Uncharacterized protein n=1 Tax=Sphingomonas parva TaxID=2555898 RepID=A0A4Y8ZR97_9SPHN|nr:hypothetical protein [Sphingomonas parva]TFI57359.1 hypothetical protein E2493_15350 [Sphingomonas parva]
MSQFDDFIDGVKQGIAPLVGEFVGGLKQDATTDMQAFLQAKAADLKTWTEALAKGEISQGEFEMLVKGAKSLLKLRALRIAGVQAARLQRLRDAFVKLVIDKAVGTFLPGA